MREVYALIDRGEFLGVFATPELAKEQFAKWKEHLKVPIEWEEFDSSPIPSCGIWRVNPLKARIGEVIVKRCRVHGHG